MYLKNIDLRHFRNYEKLTLAFSPRINVLLGRNAQGKTNLLEAIYFLAMTKSHRTSNDHELLQFKAHHGQVKGEVQREQGPVKLQLDLSAQGKKALINHIEQARLSQYVGQMNVILFAPEDLDLVKGAPSVRRRFIDMEFGQIDPQYLYALTKYHAVLKQRNQYLKLLAHKEAHDRLYLDVLSEQLAEWGSRVIVMRQRFITELEHYAQVVHEQISQHNEKLTFDYKCSVKDFSDMSVTELKEKMVAEYHNLQTNELKRGVTLLGPHRDDLRFLVNGQSVHTYGSQGQQRTTALAVKLAEIDVMKDQTGEYPLLLLDDVLSELDGQRQTHLLKAIQDRVQTFLTTPDMSSIAKKLIKQPRVLRIEDGQVTVEEEGQKVELTAAQQARVARKKQRDAELNAFLGLDAQGKTQPTLPTQVFYPTKNKH